MKGRDGDQAKAPTRKRSRRRKPRSSTPEMLTRDVAISAFRAAVRLRAIHRKGEEPFIEGQPWLELSGTATEVIKDVADVRLSLYPDDDLRVGTARPASVGAILSVRPELHAVLAWPQREFDRLWGLAVGGHLKYASLSFTKPRYGSALVVNASFGNVLEE